MICCCLGTHSSRAGSEESDRQPLEHELVHRTASWSTRLPQQTTFSLQDESSARLSSARDSPLPWYQPPATQSTHTKHSRLPRHPQWPDRRHTQTTKTTTKRHTKTQPPHTGERTTAMLQH